MTVRFLQEQADRAERLAKGILDAATCEALKKYARQRRERANVAVLFATVGCEPDKETRRLPVPLRVAKSRSPGGFTPGRSCLLRFP